MNQENQTPAPAAGLGPTSPAGSIEFSPADTTPIPASQIASICQSLTAETDPAKQRVYWRRMQHSAPSSKALDLALQCITNPTAPNRGEAVRYLRSCFPDRLPALLEAFSRDPDEEMRYQLSEFLRDSDMDAAIGMKIGMLGKASAEKQQLLIHEIAENGNLFHLEGLQGLDTLAGGNSVFARAAELLSKRTKTQAATAGS